MSDCGIVGSKHLLGRIKRHRERIERRSQTRPGSPGQFEEVYVSRDASTTIEEKESFFIDYALFRDRCNCFIVEVTPLIIVGVECIRCVMTNLWSVPIMTDNCIEIVDR